MNLDEARQLRDEILRAAYDNPQETGEVAMLSHKLQSELYSLRDVKPWNNIAVGYSFPTNDPDEVRLEVRVPSSSKKGKKIAHAIANAFGRETAVLKVVRTPTITSTTKADLRSEVDLKNEQIHLGLSIGSEHGTGSLGAFAKDAAEQVHIVSCSHVLGVHPATKRVTAHVGQPIYQPGPSDHVPTMDNEIGALATRSILSEQWVNETDSASAVLKEGISYSGNVIPHGFKFYCEGQPIKEPFADSERHRIKQVHKIGKTTGFTTGEISTWAADSFTINVETGERNRLLRYKFNNLLEIAWENNSLSHSQFSDKGDSGGLVFCELDSSLYALGIIFAKGYIKDETDNDYRPVTYACMMKNVLDTHKLSWLDDIE